MIRKSAHSVRTRRVSVHIAVVVKSAVSVKVPGNGKLLSRISLKEISMRQHIQRSVRTAKGKVRVIIVRAREAAGLVPDTEMLNLPGNF
jgi:hypothetical protein